jgi:epoxide hydrolase-like predicted phosphatase
VPTYDACLIDVFETVLSLDHLQHGARLAERAGVPPDAFAAATGDWAPRVNDGRVTLAEAVAGVLRECGAEPTAELVETVVAADRELLAELAVLHPDTVPFLESVRAAGVRTAFVSNCNENARSLLDALGLSDLVDELVLSCEVGVAKPDPKIYAVALDRLGVAAERAVLVDDQASYCASARGIGMAAIRIDRADGTGDVDTLSAVTGRLIGPS